MHSNQRLNKFMGRMASVVSAAMFCSVSAGQAVSTAITYQGALREAGSPASGNYDLRFRLYSAATGGTQIGSALCVDNLLVADGVFTVDLDFGDQYDGQARYLEIEARLDAGQGCGMGTFTLLTPRQRLSGTPFAQHALDTGLFGGQNAAFYTSASNITSGTLADGRLSANVPRLNSPHTFSGAVTFSNASSLFNGSGAGLTLLNATNVSSGTLADARLSSNVPRLNATNAFTATNTFTGSVGLGATPTGRLHITDSSNLPTTLTEASFAPFKITNGSGVGILFDSNQIESVNGPLYLNYRGSGSGNTVVMGVGGGFVGIGVDPSTPLDIALGSKNFQVRLDGGVVPGINIPYTGGNAGIMRFRNVLEVFGNDAGTAAGRITVANAASNATLSLNGDSGTGSFNGDVITDAAGANAGTTTGSLRLGGSGSGEVIASRRTSGTNQNGIDFYTAFSQRVSITNSGSVGIGTNQPGGKLDVRDGEIRSSKAGQGLIQMYVNSSGSGELRASSPSQLLFYAGQALTTPMQGGLIGVTGIDDGLLEAWMEVNTSGQGVLVADVKSFCTPHPNLPGTDIVYACIEGPEVAAYVRGTGRLVNGRATIDLPDHFSSIVSEKGITVQITPLSLDCRGLAVIAKNPSRIEIGELLQGTSDSEFDWEVKGIRSGFEDFEVLRPTERRRVPATNISN